MACGQVCQCTGSLQLRVFRLGFLQDGDIRVGAFPEVKEGLVGGPWRYHPTWRRHARELGDAGGKFNVGHALMLR